GREARGDADAWSGGVHDRRTVAIRATAGAVPAEACVIMRRFRNDTFATRGCSMRWFWVALATVGMIVSFLTSSPGVLAVALLIVVVSLFCAVFAFAAQRIASNARPDTALLTPEVLAQIREKARRDQAARSGAPVPQPPRAIAQDPQKFT
ncbi:MAG TPA: hypothetical protein VJ724_15600, partial [Tahibacter sp.]|nr:hypothetical protein [Tahibacter sp.]